MNHIRVLVGSLFYLFLLAFFFHCTVITVDMMFGNCKEPNETTFVILLSAMLLSGLLKWLLFRKPGKNDVL